MQFKKSLLTATLLAATGLMAVSANAASPATGAFNVNLTVQANCKVTATAGVQDINFGTVDADVVALTASSTTTIDVACSNTTPFQVALKPSSGNTDGTGTLTSTGSDTIPYALYSDTSATTVWGADVGSNTVDAVGTGFGGTGTFNYTATAKVLTTDVTPGTYTDLVNVSVTY